MKKFLSVLLFIGAFTQATSLFAQPCDRETAALVARNFLDRHENGYAVNAVEAFSHPDQNLAWIAHLQPQGFVLISASRDLRPVLAYSFESPWYIGGMEFEIFTTLLRKDLSLRLQHAGGLPEVPQEIAGEWQSYLTGNLPARFEQWPPEGTTPTGGWLFTNWTQSAPYNLMCPIDGNTHQRSYAGCPAVAMAQVLNCLMEIKGVQFSDDDDYYHNYAGNHFWIDDDWQDHGFPSFDSLNPYLDTVQNNFLAQKPLNNLQKAALNFACGTALKQVYSSSVSGTWGIEQAIDAYQRFGFEESRLVYDSDTSLCADLAENIKNGWPAHLGLVDPGGTVGHNVVVDGYNTDEFYHFNFGWGGSSNGWYTMPPTSAPYNLTVIEGIVMDIIGDNPHVGMPANVLKPGAKIKYLPQLHQVWVLSKNPVNDPALQVYDIQGRHLFTLHPTQVDDTQFKFSLPETQQQILLLTVTNDDLIIASEKIMP